MKYLLLLLTVISSFGAGNTVGNYSQSVVLGPNKSFQWQGKTYNFPGSTTAGLSELQQTLTTALGTNVNGMRIELAPNTIYTFSSPIFLSNTMIIEGGTMQGSIFKYIGATNLWTYQQVTNVWDVASPGNRHADTVGLFNCVTNLNNSGLLGTRWGIDYTMKNFSVYVPTNFPAYIFTAQGGNITLDHFGILGPRAMTAGTSGTFSPLNPVNGSAQQMLVGAAIVAFQEFTARDCWSQDLADGWDLAGNMYMSLENNSFYDISCNFLPGFTNIYYPASRLGIGYAHRISSDVWTGVLNNENTYNCKVSYFHDGGIWGGVKISNTKEQGFSGNGGKCSIAYNNTLGGLGGFFSSLNDVLPRSSFAPFGFVTNSASGWFTTITGDPGYLSLYQAYTNAVGGYSVCPFIMYDPQNFEALGGGVMIGDMADPSEGPQVTINTTGIKLSSLGSVSTTNNAGIYFQTNNFAATGSLFSDPVGGVLYMRSNSVWFKVAIAPVSGR